MSLILEMTRPLKYLCNYHVLLGFIILLTSFTRLASPLQCYDCVNATLSCDETTASCTHDCEHVTECPQGDPSSYGMACLAAKSPSSTVFLSCFPLQERIEYYCLLSDGLTCTCTNNNCNVKLFYPNATNFPANEDVLFTQKSSSQSRNTSHNLTNIDYEEFPQGFEPKEDRTESKNPINLEPVIIAVIIIGTIVCVVIATSAMFTVVVKIHRQRSDGMCTVTSNTDSTSLDLGTECSDTKALNGTPPLSPSLYDNVPLNLTLEDVVGRGRFAAVWRAEWKTLEGKEKTVAVKIFYEFDSTSWNVEKELFSDPEVMIQHENIIRFLKAEVRQISYPQPQRQYWLISQYYPSGSLHDYLSQNTVTWEEFCRMACSAASGISHLHADITDDDPPMNKYPVAHRDIKSSNVLMKCDGSCVIADFGLALKLDPRASERELANSGQVGTPRYMAPEALESKINLQNIESFKQIDVYSLSLVIWEIARRCTVVPDVPDYELPYTEQLCGRHPNLDEMRTIICKRLERPQIPPFWREICGMNTVANTITECWDEDPDARLTASCIAARFSQFNEWSNEEHLKSTTDPYPTTVI
ncbi:TGF-beta receptor type-2-like [Apostichopus japonicus]|uniref:TGF-beta receptor type-2-like n=1 Tax=Stichopus japonicus TaxID=307972 RepID=UPI003AB81792